MWHPLFSYNFIICIPLFLHINMLFTSQRSLFYLCCWCIWLRETLFQRWQTLLLLMKGRIWDSMNLVSMEAPFYSWSQIYNIGLYSLHDWNFQHFPIDLFQPKTDLFPTRALIWVQFKTVRYFSQPIFRLFSYLKKCITQFSHWIVSCAIFFPKIFLQLYINFTHSFVAIELLTFCKNAKKLFCCSRELSLFWPNK